MNETGVFKNIAIKLLVILLVLMGFNLIRIFSEIKNNDKLLKYYVEKDRNESDSVIQSKQKRISDLMRKVYLLNTKIKDAKEQIDSLERRKNQVEYIYIKKLNEINEYDAQQLQRYWQKVFSK
jgi:predicted RNase H-like nuclease (RuvC/YqgF family)